MTSHLLFHAQRKDGDSQVINRVTAEDAGWDLLNMEVRRLGRGESWTHNTEGFEVVMVVLSGKCGVTSNRGDWPEVGRRMSVFEGMPWALYLPRNTKFTLTALTEDVEIAHAWVPLDDIETGEDHEPRLVTPDDVTIEQRGGHHASRQINSIIPPGFGCHRLVCVEVFTPHGNWSSYPPHKHDEHKTDAAGNVIEADLEEFYYYKIKNAEGKGNGYAIQRVYTDDRSLDETVTAHDNDIVLVPEGYHPVSAAYGYDCYYLNFLAGSAQSLACSDDPDYAWTKDTWTEDNLDPRIPMVSHAMEKQGALAGV